MKKRYMIITEGGDIIKMWDNKNKQMYLADEEDFTKVPGSLEQHLRFHPMADIEETDTSLINE